MSGLGMHKHSAQSAGAELVTVLVMTAVIARLCSRLSDMRGRTDKAEAEVTGTSRWCI